jgi:hypothetical protein
VTLSLSDICIDLGLGVVKLSYPDHLFPDYPVCFVKMTGDVPLEMTKPNPTMIIIGPQAHINIFVDSVSQACTFYTVL